MVTSDRGSDVMRGWSSAQAVEPQVAAAHAPQLINPFPLEAADPARTALSETNYRRAVIFSDWNVSLRLPEDRTPDTPIQIVVTMNSRGKLYMSAPNNPFSERARQQFIIMQNNRCAVYLPATEKPQRRAQRYPLSHYR